MHLAYILADNYSRQDGWSWQGTLFGIGLLLVAGVVIKAVFFRKPKGKK